jgi:hypothetical protein
MAFPRTVLPASITRPWLPGAMKDISHSGGIQIRATKQVGWTWEESWGLLRVTDANHEALMTTIDYMWNRGVVDTVTHPLVPGSGLDPNGTGGGVPLVNGASQTGGSIITDTWSNNITNVVRAGDVLKFAGDNGVYRVRSDHNSNGSGQATINIVPNLRLSPANNAAITRTGVTFRVVVLGRSRFEGSEAPSYFAGMRVIFTEMLL